MEVYRVFKRFFVLSLLLAIVGCGSKKKSLEVHKEESREKKDLSVFERKDVNSNVYFSSDLSTYRFTPVDPKRPIKINDMEIDNAVVEVSRKKDTLQKMQNTNTTIKMSDKGETNSSKEEKRVNVETEGADEVSNDIKWSVWGIAFIVLCVLLVMFFGRIKSGVKKFREWF
ncbi:hypothetical protein J0X14_14145 [Muricauda sp. CAU 1633]|uniref:hypothetical protein n=1 Tax=Allomuricauda sp. CAU 1633 TaxID=2816036 RepID=UPI001A8E12CE|nr:hypothetical protein [Muricauda sp. CAU 1633]MBO0323445.1 hypothetical protein [Muricauda sp. CAU 1633]